MSFRWIIITEAYNGVTAAYSSPHYIENASYNIITHTNNMVS